MMRRSLVAAVAVAPLLAVLGARAHAATTIGNAVTTAQTTSTTGDLTISSGGSVILSSATTPSVTINSNNEVINNGTISNGGVANATAVQINGGFTGSTVDVPTINSATNPRAVLLNNTGSITITESYTATDSNADGVVDGPWSKQAGGYGVRVSGAGTATGDVINSGAITVAGNGGIGISIETTLNGNLSNVLITPSTTTNGTTTAATATTGRVVVVGDNAIGVSVANTGHVTGNVILGSINATGVGAEGASILGNVDGALVLNGAISVTGYRSLQPTSFAAATLKTFTADELEQGGPGVVIGANVGNGVVVAAVPTAPTNTSSTAPTVPVDADNNGIPDASQGGSIAVYGSAPAVQVGVTGVKTEIGGSQTAGATVYGFVNEGAISATGLYDQTTTPNLPAPVSATAIRIGVTGDATSQSIIDNGFHNTSSGSVSATAVDANSTGIDITTGGQTPRLVNDGTIAAATTVNDWATAVAVSPSPVTVTAIMVEQGGSLTSLTNSKTISASLTGTVNQSNTGNIGTAYAIKDASGTLVNVANTGNIVAVVSQTLTGTAPTGAATITTPSAVAIDLSQGTAAETITQTQGPDTLVGGSSTTAATATAAAPPAIFGDILLGSKNDTVNIQAGTVTGDIKFGAGDNSLVIDGSATAATGETTPRVTSVTGAITADNGTLALTIGRGTLNDTSTATIHATTVNLSSNATLIVAADPTNHTNTDFVTTGNSVIGAGATIGLSLKSLLVGQAQYTVIETAVTGGVKQGSITASTFNSTTLTDAPYLYTASASYQAGATAADADKVVLTVKQKSAGELGFNAAESQSYNAIFGALQHDSAIEAAVLAQTTKSGLTNLYDQLVPDQGQGLFDTLDQATQSVASLTAQTPDAGTRVAGSSLWLQEVNERVKRASGASLGSQSQLFGLVGGWERMGAGGGALGLTLSYLNVQDRDSAAAVGEHTVGSLLEIGGYYRRAIGGLRVSARGAGGYAFFNEDRQFVYTGVSRRALSSWGGLFADAHFGVDYEVHLGRFYARPGVSADYMYLRENAHREHGGGNGSGSAADDGFDLAISSRASHRLSGAALVTLGTQFGRTTWLRTEVTGGYRRILSSNMGDTTAQFTYTGASPFTLTGEDDKGGWYTVGFSIKGGTNLSYLALEGDADFRDGEQRYNLFISGRSMF